MGYTVSETLSFKDRQAGRQTGREKGENIMKKKGKLTNRKPLTEACYAGSIKFFM